MKINKEDWRLLKDSLVVALFIFVAVISMMCFFKAEIIVEKIHHGFILTWLLIFYIAIYHKSDKSSENN